MTERVEQPVAPSTVEPAAPRGVERVEGRSMREALLRARKTLGDKAVVVAHRQVADGVVLAVSRDVPRSTQALDAMRGAADAIFAEQRRAPSAPQPPARPPLADLERRLRANGASRKLRERVLEAVAARPKEDGHPLDLAAAEVGSFFPLASLPREGRTTAVLAFVGHTGVGKTTTIAKLATRMARAGRRIAMATLDGWRAGAVEQLEAHGRSLDVPAFPLRDAARLARDLARGARLDAVLVDGSGDLVRDVDQLQRLGEALGREGEAARLDPFVVLPATASDHALRAVTDAAAPLDPRGAVITKIDEASLVAPVLEHALRAKLPLAFLSDGPDVGRHFHRAGVATIGDLFLRGRLS